MSKAPHLKTRNILIKNYMSSKLSKKTVRGTTFIFLAEALVLPTGFMTAIFLTRRLGPEGNKKKKIYTLGTLQHFLFFLSWRRIQMG
ncbi:MAG: hypothetical protein QNJ41_25695 [Xenococcaceae cyanobacterium MO_188.B32]|nr:hypothetical protein [Xenococcaceae cyanobacterium MO_188.B32]